MFLPCVHVALHYFVLIRNASFLVRLPASQICCGIFMIVIDVTNLKQNEAHSARAESTHKGVN